MSSGKDLQQGLRSFSVYVVTWNVSSRFPDNITLRQLLGLSHKDCKSHNLPDLYAIGFQEVNAEPQQQVIGLFKNDPWTQKAKDLLKEYDYVLMKTKQMQGLLLLMFIRRVHVHCLRCIESEFTRTGFGGMWGNKGAVSIRFSLYGCSLVFVVSHLAAHDHQLDERIEDYKQILENHHYHVNDYHEIYDHDYVFWFGDLNFRLNSKETAEEICNILKTNTSGHEWLLQKDQLTCVRENHIAFAELQEELPNYQPTFKFKEGTSVYDLKRRPAWTDRILFGIQPNKRMTNKLLAVEQSSYKAHFAYTISDHKPVTSELVIKLYTDVTEPGIKFTPIENWTIGEENTVEYYRLLDFEECKRDWIGIFPVNYTSFTNYAGYECINQAETVSPESLEEDPFNTTLQQPPLPHNREHQNRSRKPLRREHEPYAERVRIDFSDDIDLESDKEYLLIYFQNTSEHNVTTVAAISNKFYVRKRDKSPRHREHSA